METLLAVTVLTALNAAQVAMLAWIARRTNVVRQELQDVLEWAAQPAHLPADRWPGTQQPPAH